ncbi:hypothetical protein [Treponema endosymbiont of Eucomonympha sp.]|uniref:hypothetical protein n=1 Tax=Treponema endosymbiont of Eucomonympha sp. TaxID=1580831 RepID=UPI0013967E06|nr:hypothetical protein [Treponema endosymbiont of Eucomonympha sp.]
MKLGYDALLDFGGRAGLASGDNQFPNIIDTGAVPELSAAHAINVHAVSTAAGGNVTFSVQSNTVSTGGTWTTLVTVAARTPAQMNAGITKIPTVFNAAGRYLRVNANASAAVTGTLHAWVDCG